jgi:hypothetical protein
MDHQDSQDARVHAEVQTDALGPRIAIAAIQKEQRGEEITSLAPILAHLRSIVCDLPFCTNFRETVIITITSHTEGIIDHSMVCPSLARELPPETLFSNELLVSRTAHHRLLDLLAAIRIIPIDRPFDGDYTAVLIAAVYRGFPVVI